MGIVPVNANGNKTIIKAPKTMDIFSKKRFFNNGKIISNGCKGSDRRLSMASVLLLKEEMENEEKRRDEQELLNDNGRYN